ncbi:Opi1-domain-containing protein [Tricholoma matsutake]|nr:Opi1-domain-containing protein [Tricholoma matsutake 945]
MNGDAPNLDEHDESVRIAVRALGDMRNNAQQGRPDLTPTSSTPDVNSPFVSRVSHLPLVNTALRAYEQGKASSRVVKYGVEMVESSVKTISRPVIDRLPVNVNQLDEFACRQLDRFDRYRRPSSVESNHASPSSDPSSSTRVPTASDLPSSSLVESQDHDRPKAKLKTKTFDGTAATDREDALGLGKSWTDKGQGSVPGWLEANSPFMGPAPPPPDSSSLTPTRDRSQSRHQNSTPDPRNEQQIAQRSRWQAVLLEAGGLSAALSEENMRRLKYCLQWLQYATAHIDAQILILRDFTASLQPLPQHAQLPRTHPISHAHMRTLTTVRRDIVQTIRQVVDVVSQYAGGALPEPARGRVRGFILELPQRWAKKAPGTEEGERERDRDRDRDREMERESVAAASGSAVSVRRGNRRTAVHRERGRAGSAASSRAPSPITSTRLSRHQDGGGDAVSASTAILAAQRILTLATESLDMVRGVTGVVKDSLDRADAWVGRLRTVGIQRPSSQEGAAAEDGDPPSSNASAFGDETDPEIESTQNGGHRRVNSIASSFDDSDAGTSFSGSSYVGGSSVPSTPGFSSGSYGGYVYGGGSANPAVIGLEAMNLSGSRPKFRAPMSSVVGLPGEEESVVSIIGNGKGVDTDSAEREFGQMDVDP